MTESKSRDSRYRANLLRRLLARVPPRLVSSALLCALASGCGGADLETIEPAMGDNERDQEQSEILGSPRREELAEQDDLGDSCTTVAYQHCESYETCAALGPNANCAAYTQARESTFCAPYCERDESCPTLPGFRAACNFAWCALLCEQGSCPRGMACVRDVRFIDGQARARGQRDVCVIAP